MIQKMSLLLCLNIFIINLSTFHYLAFHSFLTIVFSILFFYFSFGLFGNFLIWVHFDRFLFSICKWVIFYSMILVSTHLRIWMIRTSLGFLLASVEFEGQLFKYLNNLMGLNYIGEGM